MRARGRVGLALALCLALWALFAHPGTAGGVPIAATVVIAVLAWLVGAALGRSNSQRLAIAVAVVAAVTVATGAPDSLTGAPAADPLGYANANAALLCAAVAGLVGTAVRATGNTRRGLIGAALVLLVLVTATESRAATVICVVLLLLVLVLSQGPDGPWQLLSVVVVAVTFVATVLLGASHDTGGQVPVVENTVGGTRTALWADALEQANDNPTLGVGPGRFEAESATASEDAELHSAHSAPLQMGAELGWTGALLLLALAAWVIAALGRSSILFAVLALQPMIDYTLQFPLVVAVTAFVLGGLAGSRPSEPHHAVPLGQSGW